MNFKSTLRATPARSLVSYLGPIDGATESSVASLVGICTSHIPQDYQGTAYTSGEHVPGFRSYTAGTELWVNGATWSSYSDVPSGAYTRLLGTVDHQGNLRLNFGPVIQKA